MAKLLLVLAALAISAHAAVLGPSVGVVQKDENLPVSDPILTKVNIRLVTPPLSPAELMAKGAAPPELLPPTPVPDDKEYPEYYLPPVRNVKPLQGRDEQRELDMDEQILDRVDAKITAKREQAFTHDKWLDGAQRTLDKLNSDIGHVNDELTNLRNDVDSLRKQKQSIQVEKQRQHLQEQLSSAAFALENLDNRTKDLESTASTLAETKKTLEEKVLDLTSKMGAEDKKVQDAHMQAQALNATVIAPTL